MVGQAAPSSQAALNAVVHSLPPSNDQASFGALEAAVAQTPKQHVLAAAEDRQVGDPVAVHVERVRPGGR